MRTENRVALISGDRNWDDREAEVIMDFLLGMLWRRGFRILVHGAARGIDAVADRTGKLKDVHGQSFDVRPYHAHWEEYGTAAGPVRNREMYNVERPDIVIGIHRQLWLSKGTLDMMKFASGKGTPVYHLMSDSQLTNGHFAKWLEAELATSVKPTTGDETDLGTPS